MHLTLWFEVLSGAVLTIVVLSLARQTWCLPHRSSGPSTAAAARNHEAPSILPCTPSRLRSSLPVQRSCYCWASSISCTPSTVHSSCPAMLHSTRACRRRRRSSRAKQRCGRPGSASTPAIATASSYSARCMAPWPWHTATSCSNLSFFSRLACYGCAATPSAPSGIFPHAAMGRPLANVPLWSCAYRQMGLIKVVVDHHDVLFGFHARHLPANGPTSSSVVSVGCARFSCFCNRHVRQALPWFY